MMLAEELDRSESKWTKEKVYYSQESIYKRAH